MTILCRIALVVLSAVPSMSTEAFQQEAISSESFRAASATERDVLVRSLIQRSIQPSSARDLTEIIADGLQEASADRRARILALYASRVGAPRFSVEADTLSTWKAELPLLARLRPAIMAALNDSEAKVRENAVMALGNLDAVQTVGTAEPTLRGDTVAAFLDLLAREQSPSIRASVVQGIALSTNRSPQISKALLGAMSDKSAEVRQFALRGVEKLTPGVALSILERGLQDTDKAVRMTSAQMLPKVGDLAASLDVVVEQAESTESDPVVRAEMHRIAMQLRAMKKK